MFFSAGDLVESEAAINVASEAYAAAGNDYGVCQAIKTKVQLALARAGFAEAVALAREGVRIAVEHGFDRLKVLRRIDEGRALLGLEAGQSGLSVLQEALGDAVALNDHVLAFHGHHALWKAYETLGDRSRAQLELSAAAYYARFVDDFSPEVVEVRHGEQRG